MSKSSTKDSSESRGGCERLETTAQAYCRCNSGHYFQGEFCPFDGWSSPASRELTQAVRELARQGQGISLVTLRKAGVSRAALQRIIVVEFGHAASAFEALAPHLYVVNGEAKPMVKLGRDCK